MWKSLKYLSLLGGVGVLCAGSAGFVLAQEPAHEMDEAMARVMKYAQPGEHHQHLARQAGTWKAQGTFWMQPGAPPVQSTGTAKNSLILGGRFLMTEYSGDFMSQPFQGIGLEGYDIDQDKNVGVWADSMGTMMMSFEGHCTEGGKVRTMTSQFKDPATGQMTSMKAVTSIQGPDKHTYTAWMGPNAEEMKKVMEIVYTRQ
ncbi:MAG: DUF1579 domain-containing protein [Acidobacteriota bacterium]